MKNFQNIFDKKINSPFPHVRQPRAVNPKPLCLAVVMCMREIFLLQNKCWVAKVCKNRCPAVDLSNFLSQNKYRMRINTAGHLGFRLVLYGCRESAKH